MQKRVIISAILLSTATFFAFIAFGVQSSAHNETKHLRLLHVIMRHGARTPADTYPTDPYINATFAPTGWGQLTNEGKLDLYQSGVFLRGRYGPFLGEHYSPDLFYAEATDVDRTKASLQVVNAGLWPPKGAQKWGPLDWQPIPIHSQPLDQDALLLVRKPCAQYHLEREKVVQSDEIQALFGENSGLFRALSEITGKEVLNFDDVQDIYSTLTAEVASNLTLPDWTANFYPDNMIGPTIFSYTLNAYNDQLNRLKGGVLLKKLISDWSAKIDSSLTTNAFLYGGHDSTIANLLSTLKVWEPQIPQYGIMILLEFSQDIITQQFGLEIFIKNTTMETQQLTIPGCAPFCPFDQLLQLTKNVIPDNWEEECHTDDTSYVPPVLGGP